MSALEDALREAMWIVHCGQFHQWKTVEQCTDKPLRKVEGDTRWASPGRRAAAPSAGGRQ